MRYAHLSLYGIFTADMYECLSCTYAKFFCITSSPMPSCIPCYNISVCNNMLMYIRCVRKRVTRVKERTLNDTELQAACLYFIISYIFLLCSKAHHITGQKSSPKFLHENTTPATRTLTHLCLMLRMMRFLSYKKSPYVLHIATMGTFANDVTQNSPFFRYHHSIYIMHYYETIST